MFMGRKYFCLSAIALALVATAVAQSGAPQDPAAEAHHRLILENDLVRVFAVRIPEGQQTYVRHPHSFLTVTLQDGETVMWTEGTVPGLVFSVRAGDARFFLGRAALGTRNAGKTEYKNITVEFFDPRVTNYGYEQSDAQSRSYSSNALGPPPDERSGFVHALPLHLASVRDVRLLPGEQLPPPSVPAKELVIAVTDLNLQSESGRALKKTSGEIEWLPMGTSIWTNRGTAPARFVVVELL